MSFVAADVSAFSLAKLASVAFAVGLDCWRGELPCAPPQWAEHIRTGPPASFFVFLVSPVHGLAAGPI